MNQINQDQINIGNESALDLVVSQNKAKTELAENLQGLGVSANASTDTLEQLAYKVSTVSADDDRQKPHSLAVDMKNNFDETSPDHFGYFVEKNGWLFLRYGSTLKVRKLTGLKTSVNTYNQRKSAGFQSPSVGGDYYVDGRGSETKETFIFNEDGSKVYVLCSETVRVYTVDGYSGTALTLTYVKTLTPKFDNENRSIDCIDINANETQMIVSNSSGEIGIFDLTGSNTQNLTKVNSTYDDAVLKFTNDANNSIAVLYNTGSTYEIAFWTISGDQVTVLSSDSIDTGNSGNDKWMRGIFKYKDLNNHYKILFNFRYKYIDTNNYDLYTECLGVLDCATKSFSIINSKINMPNYSIRDNSSASTPIITIIGNYYYVMAGVCFAAFDSNWNCVGYIINQLYDYTTDGFYANGSFMYYTYIYDGDFYNFGEDGGTIYAMKHRLWLNKLVAYSRSVEINNFTKQLPYFAQLTAEDLDNGVYNQ